MKSEVLSVFHGFWRKFTNGELHYANFSPFVECVLSAEDEASFKFAMSYIQGVTDASLMSTKFMTSEWHIGVIITFAATKFAAVISDDSLTIEQARSMCDDYSNRIHDLMFAKEEITLAN